MTPQLFLSYASEDSDIVERLYDDLLNEGFKPWMAKRNILPGQDWEHTIFKAIRQSDFFMVCLSRNSVGKRGVIQKEINEALNIWQEKLSDDIYVIPVRLEDCEIHPRLQSFHWVNLYEQNGFIMIIKAIREGIDKLGHEEKRKIVSSGRTEIETENITQKQITALFADVSGYTNLAEKLDTKEFRDIMSQLFGDITKVILKYKGFIEKFAGDTVMALFGIPRSHEDDPVRAIEAAKEIHHVVRELSLKIQARTGQPFSMSMHIGINTGLVVTGGIHHEEQVAGDTINVASRLCSLAKEDETFVGQTTYSQTEGFFRFERLDPVKVKGKTKPIPIYKLLKSNSQ
jgi:class 3 adenylate cyclase